MKQLLIVFAVSIFGVFSGFSQNKTTRMTEKEFNELRDEINSLQTSNKDSLLVLVEEMMKIAYSFKDEQILADALLTKGNKESENIDQEQAIVTLNQALKINKKLNNKIGIAKVYRIIGLCNFRKSNYVEAAKNFLKTVDISKDVDSATTVRAYSGLSDVNVVQKNFKDALKYALLAEKYTNKHSNAGVLAGNALTTGVAYRNLNEIDKAETCFIKAAKLFKKANDNFYVAYTLNELSDLFYESDPLKSIDLRLEAKIILDEIAPYRLTSAVNMVYLGELYVSVATNDSLLKIIVNPLIPKTKTDLLKEAELLYNKALTIGIKNKSVHGILDIKEHLSQLQILNEDYKNAYENLLDVLRMNDSLFSQENKNAIAKLVSEKEVLELKSQNDKKATLNKFLIASSAALLLIGFLIFRNFKHKRKLQNLKISDLEKDKQLLTIDAMLKGQEEERSRIAKDLHDGLGSLLSGTKLSFTHMKENLILTPENAAQFDKSLNMLDTTIIDLRKVAQNLMPEALVKFGLDEALRDFCNSLQTSSKVTVDYQKIGVDRKLNNTAEVFVYRIVQELVNNAIKHAKASEIIVQLAIADNKTSITVEDNGIGYDKNNLKNKTGSGLHNIEYRVDYLHGTIDTETSLTNGTSVNIELNV